MLALSVAANKLIRDQAPVSVIRGLLIPQVKISTVERPPTGESAGVYFSETGVAYYVESKTKITLEIRARDTNHILVDIRVDLV
jgi:hypothetical protein